MSKHRIYEIAKEYSTTSKVIIDILARNNITAKNHMSSVDETARVIVERTFARKTGQPPNHEKPSGQEHHAQDAKIEQPLHKDRQVNHINKEQGAKLPERIKMPPQQPGETHMDLNKPKEQRHTPPRQQQQTNQQPQPSAPVQTQQHQPSHPDGQEQQNRAFNQNEPGQSGQGQHQNPPHPETAVQGPMQQSKQPQPNTQGQQLRQDEQNQQQRQSRPDGQNQQQRQSRPDGQNQQQRHSRPDGQNQQQRHSRPDGQNQQQRQPRTDGQNQQQMRQNGQNQQQRQMRPDGQNQQQRQPRTDGQNQQQRQPRQDGQNQQQRQMRQDGQTQQQRQMRPDGQNQQQRQIRPDGQNQQQRQIRPDGQNQQQRQMRPDGQNQQQRQMRPDGQNQQQRQSRTDGQSQGQNQQQRPFQQNNRYRPGGRSESFGQHPTTQSDRQQPYTQPGQQRSGSTPQAGRQQRPATQQRPFGQSDRKAASPGQNQKQFSNEAKNQYTGQGRQQPPKSAQPDRRGPEGARLNQSFSDNNRQFAPKKPEYAGAQLAAKQPAPGSGQRPSHKNKDRQTHQNPRGVLMKSDHETEHSRKNRQQFHSRPQRHTQPQQQIKPEIPKPKSIKLGESITVKDLSGKIAREVSEVIKKLMGLGIMATINQEIDFDTASLIAGEFGVTVEELPPEEDPTEIPEIEDAAKDLVYRPPVVTVMGHVDHGKTSLLDSIRQTNVIAQEAGGITQHIGAYQVMCQGKKIVFLDTPGHEAFTAMRARGAQITDIAILVVAADDGVMPQTIEAINHAKSAKVPIIVAINKIDRDGANPDRVKQQLSENGLIAEDWGGDAIMVPVSAYQKTGINELLEMILLVAEMLELKANPNRRAYGTIIEAKLDKGRGPVSTILVQKGTLKVGDSIIAGAVFGKVRAMTNDRGEKVKKAEPSTPVEVLGLADVPLAGDIMVAVDEKTARAVSEKRAVKKRSEELKQSHKVSLDDLFKQIQEGSLKDLNIVVKADVQGSIEALAQSLAGLKNKEVRVNIIHTGVGAINESDVMLASASNALIIGFNVRPDTNARRVADNEKVDIRTYRVIYEAINDVEAAITGMLAPEFKEVIYGRLEIRQVISIPKAVVAGSYVLEGKVTNSSQIRLIRNGIVVFEGRIESLRRFKDDVKEVSQGFECGLTIEKYRDIKEGDILESFGMEQVAKKTG